MRRHFRKPEARLPRCDLTEKRPEAAEGVMPPVREQARCLGGDMPVPGVRQAPPLVYVLAHLIDDRRWVILLLCGGKPFPFVEDHPPLVRRVLPFLRSRDRRDELGPAPAFDDLLGRLPLWIKLPVPTWTLLRRGEDGVLEKRIRHH